MASFSEKDLDALIRRAASAEEETALAATRVLFREVIEPNCDSFDPAAVARYVTLFARLIADLLPGYEAGALIDRYQHIRKPRRYQGEPDRVCVLSRVTLGADVAVTSVLLDAVKQRFPRAEICLVGPPKNLELFAADCRVVPLPVAYGRSGVLRERLLAAQALRRIVDRPGTLVIDPDSRLTQLGLIPVCDDAQYLFFESRAYRSESGVPLSLLAAEWARKTLGVQKARAYLRPVEAPKDFAITISLGVGENEEKRIGDDAERDAVAKLASLGQPILIDRGAGGEEAARVDRLMEKLQKPHNIRLHEGSFASFAAHIMASKLYFGYDSAGQHVAAASGVPLVTLFAGYACESTFARWRPSGLGPIYIVKADGESAEQLTERLLSALTSAAAEAGLS
ncbi:MAG TPA: glycosyltransferase family 9 protein [Bryobacteraceae bacterium]